MIFAPKCVSACLLLVLIIVLVLKHHGYYSTHIYVEFSLGKETVGLLWIHNICVAIVVDCVFML